MFRVFFLVLAVLGASVKVTSSSTESAAVVLVAVLSGASITFTKSSAMLWLRQRSAQQGGAKAHTQRVMQYAGTMMQVGSFCGAGAMFLLINVAGVFKKP